MGKPSLEISSMKVGGLKKNKFPLGLPVRRYFVMSHIKRSDNKRKSNKERYKTKRRHKEKLKHNFQQKKDRKTRHKCKSERERKG